MVSLEEICEQIELCLTDEALSEPSVKIINTTLLHLGNSIGLEMHIDRALEDYAISTTGGSVGQSRISAISKTDHIAKIKGYIIKIWNAIKALVIKWITNIKSYYTVFIANYNLFLAQVKKLKEAMVNKRPIKTGGKIIIPGQVYNNLITNNSIKNISPELERLAVRVKSLGLYKDVNILIGNQFMYLLNVLHSESNVYSDDDPHKYVKDVITAVTSSSRDGMVYKREGDNVFTYTDKIPYIEELKATVKLTTDNDSKSISATITSTRNIPEDPKDMEVKVLQHDALLDALDTIIDAIDNVTTIASRTRDRINAVNGVTVLADDLAKKLDNVSPEVAASKEYRLSKKMLLDFTGMAKLILEPSLTYQKQLIASSKAMYQYCLKSIATNYQTTQKTTVA